MHGQHREDAKQKRHMWSEPSQITGTDVDLAHLKWFNQGGRKISVGDTALFQAGNALPFIGIIRKLIAEKEGSLKLRVNWLYRPGDIELVKGVSLDSSPNEVFYSFHKDVISAASLLHPCKVAFLPKGVDLPPGVFSLVCRRVYDTSRKCLYWLTDQDYADEHQGEVDRLLKKTKHEMHVAGQSEKPSHRSLSELKCEAVNAAQGKSKKRERNDQSLDSIKRERHCKEEDMEPKRERAMRYEDFAAIAGKEGGLTSTSVVDQLVQVMTQERIDGSKNPVDVVPHRILLVGLVAATDKEDCLAQFVRFGGLPVLDDWLQDAHKGRLGDGHYKDSDKILEELLLILLRALERLPVDLDALKTCNVGKSVNLLKSHKNFEVQKKARKLVDTWKKRVNAEMNLLDEAKSGVNSTTTWSSRPGVEALNSQSCFTGGLKNSASAQLAINGPGPSGEAASISNYKDLTEAALSKNNSLKAHASGVSDVAAVKEEKSCSSSQSQNNSQSWCSGSGKGVGSWKEEGKAPSVVSFGNKPTGTALRSHSKGHYPVGTTTSPGLQRDLTGKHKTSGLEKVNNTTLSDKKGNEVANHSSQRLIVRLPNPGRSPAHSASGGCLIDGSVSNNKGFSSGITEKHDSLNASSRAPEMHSPDTSGDTKCGNSATKGGKIGTDCKEDINRSCIASVDDADYKSADIKNRSRGFPASKFPPAAHVTIAKKITNQSVVTTTPGSRNINPTGPAVETVEVGIDLLASVAACEGAEAEKSFSESTGGEGYHHPPTTETSRDSEDQGRVLQERDGNCGACEAGEKQKNDGGSKAECVPPSASIRESDRTEGNAVVTEVLEGVPSVSMPGKEKGAILTDKAMESVIMDGKASRSMLETTVTTQDANIATMEAASNASAFQHEGDFRPSVGVSASEFPDDCEVSTPSALDNVASLQEGSENGSKDLPSPGTLKVSPSSANVGDVVSEFYGEDALEVARQVAKEVEQEVQQYGHHEAHGASLSPDKKDPNLSVDEVLKCKENDAGGEIAKDGTGKISIEDPIPSEGSAEAGKEERDLDGIIPVKKDLLDVSYNCPKDDANRKPDSEIEADTLASVSDVGKLEVDGQLSVDAKASSVPIEASGAEKEPLLPKDRNKEVFEWPVFDLNEGLATEEGFHDRVAQAPVPVSGPSAPLPDRTGFPGHSSSLAAPVAVVSATKGSFIPPSNISRPKVEAGWKGSAATSAFRPAEPRRLADTMQPAFDTTGAMESMVVNDQDGRQTRILDIDLNVADYRVMEETNLASVGEADVVSNGPAASRPELDLNRVDESDESPVLPQSNGRLPVVAPRAMLDFDLNDGLGCEEAGVEEDSSRNKNPMKSSLPVFAETRPPQDFVNVFPWYTSTSSTMPAAMMIPAFPTSRPDLPYPVVAAPGVKSAITTSHSFSQFGGNSYQGGAPISCSNVGYPPPTFPHAGYPFGGGFPPFTSTSYNISSASNAPLNNTLPFPTTSPSQLVSAGAVMSPFGRPYLGGSIAEAPGSDVMVSRARSTLDLNADLMADLDSKDEGYGTGPSFGHLQYQQVGTLSGPVKRKEPEGGFDAFRSNFKQMAWRE
ncbi:hypothetical protein GOP47_0013422 [Adiantum capillus-veneris]|uniref:Uncharacterized protein n=1 Tax=Adiantum capillus-veneris TaxID=13818 RepID=A0A9D4ZFR7_ADICA|nr:hypothetical protein GOP47_0013422 [Adiantum capillus-veneris]